MRVTSAKCEKTAIKSEKNWKGEKPIPVYYWGQKVVFITNLRENRYPIIIEPASIKFLVPP